ncbi:two-component, sigma-54 specific, transcriptional regulator, Fis family [Azoarcus sp. CIB]|uniref:sigma-54-dependent transcriptional regulator n=1 Tax=Aromatoleum sp. (strain CIB) TaxID=198107 RepID=UPI00067D20DB|nr:sigma-54 dependent transcriptional regulator [Azoarcus sp. CIB]AKU12769.1 two-component, sigma-54 specific, transcriptional regulator, Fis family [Azoarcus sp. CIB]
MKGHVLIVDDESLYRQLLTSRLGRAGYRLSEAADGEAALECAQHGGVDLALVDIKMPGIDGIEVLKRLKQLDPQVEVVILTGHGNVDSAIAAMKLGAFDYLSKPYKLTELDIVVERALEKRMLARRCAALSAEVAHLRGADDTAVIGESEVWRRTLELVRRAAPLDLPVLITGESGAGKEIVAGLLHRWSQRAQESYVPLNCGLLDDDLVESELFGHKRGAFSGASADKEGLFELASGGTLFLDEIGELPAACQAKLLRVLDSGEFRQLGATALRRTNARVIAATHRDLDALVADGKFRHDLLYRLNVVHIPVPALRERPEDIPLLADYLIRRSARGAAQLPDITPAALARLTAYTWPGNVRELRNAVERLVAFGDGQSIDEDSVCAILRLPVATPPAAKGPSTFSGIVALEDFERDYVTWVLAQLDGNVSAAAQALGVSRSTVYRYLRSTAAAE